MLQTVADPYLALREATGQWQAVPVSVTQRVEAAKAYVRRTCDPNANRVSNQSNWDPKNLVMLSAGSSVVNPDMLSAFWEWFTAILAEKGATWATAGTFAAADGPLPFGDAIASILFLWSFMSDIDVNSRIEAKVEEEEERSKGTIIYRMGSGNATNLTPRPVDITGLSYTTERPVGQAYTWTTIEMVNSTGKLIAIKDGATHVSVVPVDLDLLPEWIESRSDALRNPHELTVLLQNISAKVKKG